MPELPDLEVIKENLLPKVRGQLISHVTVFKPSSAKPSAEAVESGLRGNIVKNVERKGKFTILRLKDKRSLLIHLMLHGQMDWASTNTPEQHRIVASLGFGDSELRIIDASGWAKLFLVPPGELDSFSLLSGLGPDPFDPGFTSDYLKRLLANFPGSVKFALMEQKALAGIGNAYSDEILFCAKIRPTRKATALSEADRDRLYKCIRETLRWGIVEAKARMPTGIRGEIREFLHVHGKEGQPCSRCEGIVGRFTIEGRGAYYCPRCQT